MPPEPFRFFQDPRQGFLTGWVGPLQGAKVLQIIREVNRVENVEDSGQSVSGRLHLLRLAGAGQGVLTEHR